MPLKLDDIDYAILKALMEDGRRSFRQIASAVSVSTPTVESRFKRMVNTGLIKKIAPVIDSEKLATGISAFILLKVQPSNIDKVSASLAKLEEVREIFTTTGESNLKVKVVVNDPKSLDNFIKTQIGPLEGVMLLASDVITMTIKDEPSVTLKAGVAVKLNCDYCGAKIEGYPVTLRLGDTERYLCCKTCLSAYKEKYGSKIRKLSKPFD